MKRAIITTYCVTVLLTVLIVPWKGVPRQVGNMQFGAENCGYSFLFSPPQYCYNGTIEYGFVLLELIAISAVAAIFFIVQDHMTEVWQNSSKQPIWKKCIVTVLKKNDQLFQKIYGWLFRFTWRFYLLFFVLCLGLGMIAVSPLNDKYGDNISNLASIVLLGIVIIFDSLFMLMFMLTGIALFNFYFLDRFLDRKDGLKEGE